MPPNIKPAIVLVHGAWHVPEHYTSFIQHLHRSSFDVFCPRLPTCDATKRLTSTMFSDAQVVRSQLISLIHHSREIIMLLHSYGGTEAVNGLSASERPPKGLRGGVTHLIYMCAFMLQVGESVGGASLPRPVPEPVERDPATGTTFLCEPPSELFYADLEPERAREMEALLARQSGLAIDGCGYVSCLAVYTDYLFEDDG
ncbi:hypothetical protein BDR22DRAFT_804602 [Usnea florida]